MSNQPKHVSDPRHSAAEYRETAGSPSPTDPIVPPHVPVTGAELVTAYVGVGANMGETAVAVEGARRALRAAPGVHGVVESPHYRTRPVGDVPQDDYLNCVFRVETELAPLVLLDLLQSVEQAFGRERTVRWGPRTLDLDLLLYGDRRIRHPRLTVPHPEMAGRGFVLVPLAELSPDVRHPDSGHTAAELCAAWRDGVSDPEREVYPAAGGVQ